MDWKKYLKNSVLTANTVCYMGFFDKQYAYPVVRPHDLTP